MATLTENRDERANAILSYYTNLQEYNTQTDLDGTDVDDDKPQGQFKAFNDLIKLHHDELKDIVGYASSATAYLPSEEGPIDTTEWWTNADGTNLRASLFFIDSVYLLNRDAMYVANAQSDPNKRHPYSYWNQYNTNLGTDDDFGYANAAPGFSYTDTLNPFATGANYRLKEPFEHYGGTSNLLWGNIVHDGTWAYRNNYLNNTSYVTHSSVGFNNYTRTGISVGNYNFGTFNDANMHPSPFEAFRYTYFGTGAHTAHGSETLTNHSGTVSGSFRIDGQPATLSINTWYAIYNAANTSQGWMVYITAATPGDDGIVIDEWITYSYNYANYPAPTSGQLDGTWTFVANPTIPEVAKLGTGTNGLNNIWSGFYNYNYASNLDFESSTDAITAASNVWSLSLGDYITFDYTVINTEAGSNVGESEAAATKALVDAWVPIWKGLIGDTGSGTTFTVNDAKWSDANMNGLLSNGTGGLDLIVDFTGSSYSGTQTGYIADRRATVYNLLGSYNLGTSEIWNPSIEQFITNNTGYLDSGDLYYYRNNFMDSRLNRETGTLAISRNAYYTYTQKLTEIIQLEAIMTPVITANQYDVTPYDFDLSLDEEDKIVVDWEDIKAASSYNIERKDGITGSWAVIETNFGYTPTGTPPDFEPVPPSRYEDQALTQGYQDLGLTFVSQDVGTGLNEDFTLYDFNIDIDGAGAVEVSLKGLDCKTFEALRVAMQDQFDEDNLEVAVSIVGIDIRVTSNKRGIGSSVLITAGTTNDLLTALMTTPDIAVDGTTQLEQGKVYYYRLTVNNGYLVTLGDGRGYEDKDWNSQSAYQTEDYENDKAINGDFGAVLWDPPEDLTASGVDEGITASDSYCRLEWTAAPNAESYKVYRATSLNGGYALIGTTSDAWFEDTTGLPGFVYFYKLKALSSTEYQAYDDDGFFTGPIESLLTDEGVRGKMLWLGTTITATDDDIDKVTITWGELSGATGYLLYRSAIEDGQYSYITNDDATPIVLTGGTYIDERQARQFFDVQYELPTDGIPEADYEVSQRYSFQVLGTGEAYGYTPTIEEYWITSPPSGVWAADVIADEVNRALAEGYNNATCEVLYLENPSPYYTLRLTSIPIGVDAAVVVKDGGVEPSLLTVLPIGPNEPGDGAYTGMYMYYKVQAVEVVNDEIVRSSELSEIAIGLRPLDLPTL